MSEKNEELRNKFNKTPSAPPPPPRKKKRGNADIVSQLISNEPANPVVKEEKPVETEKQETVDNSKGTDSTDGTASFSSQLRIPLDGDSENKVQPVHTDHTGQTVQTILEKPRRKARPQNSNALVKKTFKFTPAEVSRLEEMAYHHRMTMTDLIRMGLLLAYVELDAIEKNGQNKKQAE